MAAHGSSLCVPLHGPWFLTFRWTGLAYHGFVCVSGTAIIRALYRRTDAVLPEILCSRHSHAGYPAGYCLPSSSSTRLDLLLAGEPAVFIIGQACSLLGWVPAGVLLWGVSLPTWLHMAHRCFAFAWVVRGHLRRPRLWTRLYWVVSGHLLRPRQAGQTLLGSFLFFNIIIVLCRKGCVTPWMWCLG